MAVQKELLGTLQREFLARKAKNSAYSLRAFATFLGIPPSGLSDILLGKRKITKKMGAKFSEKLHLSREAVQELHRPVTNHRLRLKTVAYRSLDIDTFSLISEWHHLAILTLSQLNDFVGEAEWIATRLGISRKKSEEGLRKLVNLGLLEVCDPPRNYKAANGSVSAGKEIPHAAIQRSHQEHLELASLAIQQFAFGDRDFSFINIATDFERIREAKMKIQKFRRSLCDFLEASEKKDEIFRLGMQLFPLTEIRKKGRSK